MRKRIASFKPVMAADDEDMSVDSFLTEDTDTVSDAVDQMSDTLDDIQDTVDEISDSPQDTILDMNNNISDHYIAECTRCHDVFISAVVASDTVVDSIQGECPLCHENTKQDLKWIIKDVNDVEL